MLNITDIVGRLSACFNCKSEDKSATDNGQKAKPGNVNKIVNITISPSSSPLPSKHEVAAINEQAETVVPDHKPSRPHSVCFTHEVEIEPPPLRLPRARLKNITHVSNRENIERLKPPSEAQESGVQELSYASRTLE
ncbi:hypothetical protein ABK905_26125 [Acerihabitans sp. KWT182]|uniref:Uncharacterized protein n=1 Tax=Acerihabitans sp. KWT182 TaxID=3157919 RepID=A0AAU7Q9V8_9GAMM